MPVCDLDKRRPHGKKVMGIDVVVWWDKNESEWKVFDDSCPHRLAPLSEGRIDQWGRLQYEVMIENLMDPAHVPYAHYGLMQTRIPVFFCSVGEVLSMASSSTDKQVEVCGVEDFKLSLDENPELGNDVVEKSVVAKLYSKRTIFNGLLRSILGRKWRLANGWKLIEVGLNTFIIQLTRKQEAVNIVRNGPWTIGNGFLVVKAMPEDGRWKSADLNSTPIWVRVYEVPPRFWTQKNANAIAKKIGTVVSIDRLWRNGFPTNEYIRLQVSIPLNKPLFVGLFLPMEEGVSLWCYFKYENMPSVCYKCGIVGHEELYCRRKRRLIADDFNRTVPMYGPWIRLGSRKKDCFSEYEIYEQDRMNREVLEAQNQAEARALLIPGEDNFEPALAGTEIHLEALVEAAAANGDRGNSIPEEAVTTNPPEEGETAGDGGLPVYAQRSEEGQKGNLSLKDVHGTPGNVIHIENKDNTCGFSEGAHQICLNKKDEVKKVGEVDSSHVDHLAMVFKATLGSRNGSAHKRSRPVRGKGKMLAINDGPKLSYDNASGVGKKRRLEVLEGGSTDRPWKILSHGEAGNEEDGKKDSDQSKGEEAEDSKKFPNGESVSTQKEEDGGAIVFGDGFKVVEDFVGAEEVGRIMPPIPPC
ncbi:hypothetical protein G4B88_026921 [Cannabis sativa]|uniref:Rieske domain-containing protein n=1 Tax=Cannabis sativa TaxID=3483 RepID=A0A7J6EGP4_CANSA|nr:hypothetical protein G4B88_026921 [Cannabis sativa]